MKKMAMVFVTAWAFVLSGVSMAGETLELLTWEGYAPKYLVDKFEQETGIKVETTYSNNEEMIAKLRATRGAGFDLVQPSQDRISSVQQKFGIYQPIDYSRIDSAQIIPSMLQAVKANTRVKKDSYAVPFCYGTSGLIVNRKKAPDANDYGDLLNPAYAGRISYRLKRPTLIALAFGAGEDPFAAYANANQYQRLMEEIGERLIAGKPLVKNYYANGDALLEMMRSGEVDVALGWDNGGWKLHADNPDIDFVAPQSGALGWIDTFAIPAKAKNVDAAYKWINFMLRPENASYFTNREKYGTASSGAMAFLDAEIRDNFNRSFSTNDIDNIKWYPPVPAKLEQIEGKILDRVKAAR